MQLPIKGRREKESISEIQSKPTPAEVTAKTVLISPSVCTAVQNRRRPPACQSESCHAGHPAPGPYASAEQSRFGCEYGPYPPQGRIPTLPHRSDASGASVRTTSPTAADGTPALCHSQNVRACPRKRRNNIPGSSGRNACALPFAVCTNVPSLTKESCLCHTEGGARPRSAICRTSGRVRASVETTSPGSSGRNACALPFAVCTNVPTLMKGSYL